MYEITSVQCIYFSPTKTTKAIVEQIAAGTGLKLIDPIDITIPRAREEWTGEVSGDLLIVGVPVYTGKHPKAAAEALKKLSAEGSYAIPVAVCGNVRMGSCLAELAAILKQSGTTIPAAGNFVAQHSFVVGRFTMGKDRPDKEDMELAGEFGSKAADRIRNGADDITCVYRGNLYIRAYTSGSVEAEGFTNFGQEFRERIKVSEHDAELCNECGDCVDACPVGVIAPTSFLAEDVDCIRCFACVDVCPTGAKKRSVKPAPALVEWFEHRSKERSEPRLFY